MTNYFRLVSVEIGNIADNIVVAEFTSEPVTLDFTAGIIIKVNGTSVSILSARKFGVKIQYKINQSVISTDTITLSYTALPSTSLGLGRSERFGDYTTSDYGVVMLETFSNITVTNNVPSNDPIGDALRAVAKAYWKMDETSGTRMDATGNGLDLSDHLSNISSVAGKIGNAAAFSDNGILKYTAPTPFNMAGKSFSFSGWVKVNSLEDGGIVFSKGDIDDAIEYQLEWEAVSSRFVFKNMGDDYSNLDVAANSFGAPTAGVYVFVYAFTDLVANTIGISVNNGTKDTTVFALDNLNGNTPFSFGGEYSSFAGDYSLDFNGAPDEWLFMERILTDDELAYLYNSGDGRTLYP